MQLSMATVNVTTTAGGVFSQALGLEKGILMRISYKPHASTPLDTGADLTITENDTGVIVYTQADIGLTAFTKLPRAPICPYTTGVDSTVYDYIPILSNLTLTIAQGGNAKIGTFYIYYGEY